MSQKQVSGPSHGEVARAACDGNSDQCSAEGAQIDDETFPIWLAFHKVTDPHCDAEAARQATLSRMEREDFVFPEFSVWIANRPGINADQAA